MPDKCRYPPCDNEARGYQEGVSVYGARFCSTAHELKYDHIKDDAKQAKINEQERREQDEW